MTVLVKGTHYSASALTLGDLRTLTKEGHLAALSTPTNGLILDEAQIAASIAVISASFSRKHPECTRDWVADNLELLDVQPAIQAVLEASGFVASASPKEQSL
jgi:hypothetical protein